MNSVNVETPWEKFQRKMAVVEVGSDAELIGQLQSFKVSLELMLESVEETLNFLKNQ